MITIRVFVVKGMLNNTPYKYCTQKQHVLSHLLSQIFSLTRGETTPLAEGGGRVRSKERENKRERKASNALVRLNARKTVCCLTLCCMFQGYIYALTSKGRAKLKK